MGCGGSKLKGDEPSGLGGAAESTPMRKVETNKSQFKDGYTVEADPDKRKVSLVPELAPHESHPRKSDGGPDGADDKLEPYKSNADPSDIASP